MVTGHDLLRVAATKIGQRYVFGAFAPKNDPNYQGPWDCAEFGSWVIFQVTGRLFGCNTQDPAKAARADAYTGWYERDAMAMGRIISAPDGIRVPGAILLLKPKTGAIGHCVFSTGDGGTIEAQNPRKGVIRSRATGRLWDYGIVLNFVQYTRSEAPAPTLPPIVYRITTPLMQGRGVADIQRALLAKGYRIGIADGLYGPKTHLGVVAFQKNNGLTADGMVGQATARGLGINLR